jgi:hypothetical protein
MRITRLETIIVKPRAAILVSFTPTMAIDH